MSPIGSIQGLASGIQWQDMIDQISALDTQRELTPIKDKVTANQARLDAWKAYQSVVSSFRDAAAKLRDATAFDGFSVNVANSATTGRTLLTATASSTAAPGTYQTEVDSLAAAEKLGSKVFADSTSAANISGTFLIGGKSVTLAAGDSLAAIRDKINAVNTGTSPSNVSASILTVSTGAVRLVLSSAVTGSAGIEISETDGNTAVSDLGIVASTYQANTVNGKARSFGLNTVEATIAQALGVTMPPPSSVKVNGVTVSIDLSQDSLTTIMNKINAAAGSGTASISSETVNGATVNRLVVNGSVTSDGTANSESAVQLLGFEVHQRTGDAQVLTTNTALLDSANGNAAATASSLLVNVGASAGDTLTFSGTRVDGQAVTVNVAVTSSTTLQDVLNALSSNTTGFAVAGHAVNASIVGGKIQLADAVTGDSSLYFSGASNNAGGGTLTFGGSSVVTTGRSMQLATPADALIKIDGATITRSSNTISDAIAGVTLNLQKAEVGTTVNVDVTHDTDATVAAVKAYATAYNAVKKYVTDKTAANGPLPFDSSLRSTLNSFKNILLGPVTALQNTTYTSAALVGVALDKDGQLQVDDTALKAALAANPSEVRSLFATTGSSTLSTVQYMTANAATKPGTYAVSITQAATKASVTSSSIATTYGNAATANQMIVTDGSTGKTTTIALNDTDTASDIVARLNTAFGNANLQIGAAVANTNQIQLTGNNYGSSSTITVSFALNGAAAAQQIGFASGAAGGLDVAGTIGGYAATGSGQLLTANAPATGDTNNAQGLSILYTDSANTASANVTYVLGLGGMLTQAADAVSLSGTGTIDTTTASLQSSIDSLTQREDDIQARLDQRKAALVAQFTAMETALSKIQAQGQWLTSQINALSSLNTLQSGSK
ncbi:MAG TPA: flagellar filament capping protein FliD [Gemmatimonadaceae bacterium]